MSRYLNKLLNHPPTRLPQQSVHPLLNLWLLRLLVLLNGQRDFIVDGRFNNPVISEAIGLSYCPEVGDDNATLTIESRLKSRLQAVEQQESEVSDRSPHFCALHSLTGLLGLNAIESQLLEFAVVLQVDQTLQEVGDSLGDLSGPQVLHTLSVTLDLHPQDVRAAFGAGSVLTRSGLLQLRRRSSAVLSSKIELLSDGFGDLIQCEVADPIALLRDSILPCPHASLAAHDFPLLQVEIELARHLLRRSLNGERAGVNMLIHGHPGTGKTQLARYLADSLGVEMFAVSSEDEHGDPISGERRLQASRAAQHLLGQRKALVLFDEVEDVFGYASSMDEQRSIAQSRKAWLNRMLEENRVPVIWVSNRIDALDPAFVRRFELVIEMPGLTRDRRKALLQHCCGPWLEETAAHSLSVISQLEPGVIVKTAEVMNLIKRDLLSNEQNPDSSASKAYMRMVRSMLKAQGHPAPMLNREPVMGDFDTQWINASVSMLELMPGLRASGYGRLCFHGPPGTGKSAAARWLAEQLQRPLLIKNGADLLSSYVGETEQRIANAFREASNEGALLVLDEVDSFLHPREQARHRWEIGLVNELLTQMEQFEGIFIATTNRKTDLDVAAMRRFDFKVHFDYLSPNQLITLFIHCCESWGLVDDRVAAVEQLSGLKSVTPGDMAALGRRHQVVRFKTASCVATALWDECHHQAGHANPIGFVTAEIAK